MPVIKFNENTITQLSTPEGKKRIEYVDADFPGLYLEIRTGYPGKGTWYYRYASGQNKTMSHHRLGHSNKLSLTEIRQMAGKVKAEIDYLGADPVAQEKARLAVIDFDTFFKEHYLPYVKPRKRSWESDVTLYELRISSKFGKKRLNEVTRQQIQTFHSEVLAEGLAPATANHYIKLIRRFYSLAVEWNMVTTNPAARIPMFLEDNKVERYMDDVELARLLKVLKTDSRRGVCNIALMLLATGARLNEVLSATWDQFDLDSRVWRIPASNSKSRRMRPVPINDSAMAVINQLDTKGAYAHLFINKKTKLPYASIHKIWEELRVEAELPRLRIHDLRHQAASMLINSGSSLYLVGQVLGHADPITTQRYAHLSIKSLHEASAGASAIIAGAMPTEKDMARVT
ncbi:tyrosine-type recombinase/integrase [Methylotenera sp.]|uniref:tyrosine-type recombinase/integrase n=1 Tax=Methylotenera sp. TaxID=2051956 RepID=UPI002ED914AA